MLSVPASTGFLVFSASAGGLLSSLGVNDLAAEPGRANWAEMIAGSTGAPDTVAVPVGARRAGGVYLFGFCEAERGVNSRRTPLNLSQDQHSPRNMDKSTQELPCFFVHSIIVGRYKSAFFGNMRVVRTTTLNLPCQPVGSRHTLFIRGMRAIDGRCVYVLVIIRLYAIQPFIRFELIPGGIARRRQGEARGRIGGRFPRFELPLAHSKVPRYVRVGSKR